MKYLTPILIVAILGAGGWWTWDRLDAESQKGKADRPQTTEVKTGSIEDIVKAGGHVEPVISTVVRSEVTGRIDKILIEDGASVEAGQVLLELEKTERQTELEEAKRLFEAQQLRVARARRDYERLAGLRQKNFTNEKDFLDAETELRLMEIDLEVRRARLEKARDNLAKTTIVAPHGGVVSNFDLNPGQVITGATSVNEGTTLMTINDLLHLHVRTKINELDINKIREGMEARITFDALPDEAFVGRVDQIFSYAEREGNERIFRVLVTFEARNQIVRPGISATVELPIAQAVDVPVVTPTALFKSGSGFVAYRQNGDGWDKVAVQTGLTDARSVQITSCLQPGDIVSLSLPDSEGPSAES